MSHCYSYPPQSPAPARTNKPNNRQNQVPKKQVVPRHGMIARSCAPLGIHVGLLRAHEPWWAELFDRARADRRTGGQLRVSAAGKPWSKSKSCGDKGERRSLAGDDERVLRGCWWVSGYCESYLVVFAHARSPTTPATSLTYVVYVVSRGGRRLGHRVESLWAPISSREQRAGRTVSPSRRRCRTTGATSQALLRPFP